MKLEGIALAGLISNICNYVLMTILFWFQSDIQDTFSVFPNINSLTGLWDYMLIGLPSVAMVMLDFWAYELMAVVSGLLGVKQ